MDGLNKYSRETMIMTFVHSAITLLDANRSTRFLTKVPMPRIPDKRPIISEADPRPNSHCTSFSSSAGTDISVSINRTQNTAIMVKNVDKRALATQTELKYLFAPLMSFWYIRIVMNRPAIEPTAVVKMDE